MAIKTITRYADTRGKSEYILWCKSEDLSISRSEAYPRQGYTEFLNLPTEYESAKLIYTCTINNSTSYGYSGTPMQTYLGGYGYITSTQTITRDYTLKSSSYGFSMSGGTVGAITDFDGYIGWEGEDDIQRYSSYITSARIEFQITIPDATINNLTTLGNFWERDITVNWRSENQAGYEYELYYNNEKISDGAGTTSKTFTIPANTFKGTLPASVRVRTYNTDDEGIKYYSAWAEQNITLKDIEATISNLIITGEYWEEDIVLSWQSTDQQQLKIEVWKDNTLQNTYTGTTATTYTIPRNTLSVGTYLIKVWTGYANRFVNNQSKNITLRNITPTLSNLSLSGSNIDYSLVLSWDSTYQNKAIIEAYKGSDKVITVNLTTEKNYTIVNNTLIAGAYTFKVKVAYTGADGDRWTEFIQLNTTLVESLPSIGALQPDGVILDKNSPIKAWWTSQNQSQYTLEVIGGGYSYTGTTEKEHIIPQGTLQVGTYTMRLTVIYVTSNNIQKSITKESKFIVTGKPNTPTIISNNSFSYNRPVITWDSAEQLGFICIVEDLVGNTVWSSDWQNGLITRVKCMKYLENGTYRVKVQIMNEFNIKSDYAIQQITVESIETVNINLNVEDVEFGKKLIWTNEDAYYDAFYIIRNDVIIAKTDKLEYYDYTCKHGENAYIVRCVTKNDTYKDSDTIITDFKLPYATLATVDMPHDCIDIELQRDNYSNDMSHSINSTTIYLNGREDPVVILGEHITEQYSIEFVNKNYNKFIDMCDRRKTFVYRDRFGKVLFLSIASTSLKSDRAGSTYSCVGLKVNYREGVDYD